MATFRITKEKEKERLTFKLGENSCDSTRAAGASHGHIVLVFLRKRRRRSEESGAKKKKEDLRGNSYSHFVEESAKNRSEEQETVEECTPKNVEGKRRK